jgi:hypothetical protein
MATGSAGASPTSVSTSCVVEPASLLSTVEAASELVAVLYSLLDWQATKMKAGKKHKHNKSAAPARLPSRGWPRLVGK